MQRIPSLSGTWRLLQIQWNSRMSKAQQQQMTHTNNATAQPPPPPPTPTPTMPPPPPPTTTTGLCRRLPFLGGGCILRALYTPWLITFVAGVLLPIQMVGAISQAPVVAILTTHIIFLVGGLVELRWIRYWRWRQDAPLWTIAQYLSGLFVVALIWSLFRGSIGEVVKSTEAVVAVFWHTLFVAHSSFRRRQQHMHQPPLLPA